MGERKVLCDKNVSKCINGKKWVHLRVGGGGGVVVVVVAVAVAVAFAVAVVVVVVAVAVAVAAAAAVVVVVVLTHALKNYSRVLTRLWNNFFWNNFQGIIFEGGRYTIMHVGI